LEKPEIIKVVVIDRLGSPVKGLSPMKKGPGKYLVEIDVSSLPAGLYFVKINAGQRQEAVKIVKL
jgi:hypothetical protein